MKGEHDETDGKNYYEVDPASATDVSDGHGGRRLLL